MDLRNILPSAAVMRLQESGEADVVHNAFPVDRELQIAKRFARDVFDVALLRKQYRLRDRDAYLASQRKVEELIVRRPPERVVDNVRSLEGHSLEHRPVVG